jgi:hypothetical protein
MFSEYYFAPGAEKGFFTPPLSTLGYQQQVGQIQVA